MVNLVRIDSDTVKIVKLLKLIFYDSKRGVYNFTFYEISILNLINCIELNTIQEF